MAGTGGKREGAGRKSKAEELGLAELMESVWKMTERKKALTKIAQLANNGDLKAFEILMAYTYGKPSQTVNVGNADDKPFRTTFVLDFNDGNGTDNQD